MLVHLLLVLPHGQPATTLQVKVPSPELVLVTLISRNTNPPTLGRIRPETERATAMADDPQRNSPQDNEASPTPDAATANHLRSLLHTSLDRHFIYPAFARRQGWEGRVDVLVRLERDGRLNALRIVRSSGYRVLDEDALLTLQRIGAIPQARPWLRGYSVDMQLPVHYRLTES